MKGEVATGQNFGGHNKMRENFYVTKGVNERLNIRLVIYIQTLIDTLEVEKDYLQIFDISGDKLIHTQEEPSYKREYRLSKKHKNEKLFCIRTDEENRSYWTLMYASEY